jgi:Zn finger protein HypA/HybF involved in hydrogenase expression
MPEARCMKCREQVEVKDGVESVTKNNMRILKGVCPECGTKVARILGKAK